MPATTAPRFAWRWVRVARAEKESVWRNCLGPAGYDPVIFSRPGARRIRLEVYGRKTELSPLIRVFGGRLEAVDTLKVAQQANRPRRPLRIGADLAIIDAHDSWPVRRQRPRVLLRIGGAMAFGTGEHATTSACLRFLRGMAAESKPGWTMLDIGTGSGILAIAAEKLGAARVDAFDYDPRAVSAAKTNLKRNRCRKVHVTAKDLRHWKPRRRYPFVAANVFSEVLRAAAPAITSAVAPHGRLILSGILRSQEKETLGTFAAHHFQVVKVQRRGKWVTALLRAVRKKS